MSWKEPGLGALADGLDEAELEEAGCLRDEAALAAAVFLPAAGFLAAVDYNSQHSTKRKV